MFDIAGWWNSLTGGDSDSEDEFDEAVKDVTTKAVNDVDGTLSELADLGVDNLDNLILSETIYWERKTDFQGSVKTNSFRQVSKSQSEKVCLQ